MYMYCSAFTNQGQVCLAGSRVFVERSVYDRYVEAVVAKVRGQLRGLTDFALHAGWSECRAARRGVGVCVAAPHTQLIRL
jgi:hypothetical protein